MPNWTHCIKVDFDPEKLPKISVYASQWCQAKTELSEDGKTLKISANSEHLLDVIWMDLNGYAKRHNASIKASWCMPTVEAKKMEEKR